ncbi:hypothetical protein, partial [Salmonella enterica]|uniref:hypothetical protein n=1 Tax=Salmonella enterica TaxID=28901 RepID=UPI003EDC2D95
RSITLGGFPSAALSEGIGAASASTGGKCAGWVAGTMSFSTPATKARWILARSWPVEGGE